MPLECSELDRDTLRFKIPNMAFNMWLASNHPEVKDGKLVYYEKLKSLGFEY